MASKSRNRSLKSEFTDIKSLHSGGMQDEFPGGLEPDRERLRLPILDVKAAIQVFQFAAPGHFDDFHTIYFTIIRAYLDLFASAR